MSSAFPPVNARRSEDAEVGWVTALGQASPRGSPQRQDANTRPLPDSAEIEPADRLEQCRSFVLEWVGDLPGPALQTPLQCRHVTQVESAGHRQGTQGERHGDAEENLPGRRAGERPSSPR